MGTLFYVVGASGAGKDSLMQYARNRIGGQAAICFAHRYITRPVEAGGENHVALSRDEFARRKALGLFALDWESHGQCYGLGCEVDLWLQRGASVVMNGSRGHLTQASIRYPTLCVVLIEVSPAALRRRLQMRARESESEIELRLLRSTAFSVDHPNLIVLRNDSSLEEAGERLVEILREAGRPVEI